MTTPRYRTSHPHLAASACIATLTLGTAAAAMDLNEAEQLLAKPEFRDAAVLLDWSETAIAAALEADGFQTLYSNRAGPMMHLAMHDALNAIVPVYRPYAHDAAEPGAHPVAAASQAAHDVLVAEFPDQAEAFAELHADWLATVPEGAARDAGRDLGAEAAAAILAARADDGHDSEGSFTPGDAHGAYRMTPPHDAPVGTGWAATEPFAMDAPDQFRPGPPPALDSARYAEDFAEVKRLGGKDSTERTDEQTHVGYWWAEYSTVGYPDFARARIAEDGTHLWPAARLFALLAIDNFDALVSAWDAKYAYELWRPRTAIRGADADGNPATTADPDWEPEMTTPPHPDYPAALSTLCAGGAEILKDAFGPDTAFTRASGSAPEDMPDTRHYDTLGAAVESCTLSRIYNGFHFRAGLEAGVEMGRDRAAHVLDTQLVRRTAAAGITFPD
jgi:hypothetical protein